MKFYVYKGSKPLGQEQLGSDGKYLWSDLKTIGGAIKRAKRTFKSNDFMLYSYSNFYDNKTFKLHYGGK